MPKLIDLARVLFSPLLLILSACNIGGTTYSNRIANDGHDVLSSKARVRDGVARFECKASDSGRGTVRLRHRPETLTVSQPFMTLFKHM